MNDVDDDSDEEQAGACEVGCGIAEGLNDNTACHWAEALHNVRSDIVGAAGKSPAFRRNRYQAAGLQSRLQ